jgi:N6-adenosine-specific RNA methylase IME4
MAETILQLPAAQENSSQANIFHGLAGQYGTILIDPPWRFMNRTGKVGPEHRRLHRYQTMSFEEISNLPVGQLVLPKSHLYLWSPNALLLEALTIMKVWGVHVQNKHRLV